MCRPNLILAVVAAVLGCIALPNEGSVALHEKFGFEKIGSERVGWKFDRWVDVGYCGAHL
jgi:phosphinothricin acetyltransferase